MRTLRRDVKVLDQVDHNGAVLHFPQKKNHLLNTDVGRRMCFLIPKFLYWITVNILPLGRHFLMILILRHWNGYEIKNT
jgi:hypothetical protein